MSAYGIDSPRWRAARRWRRFRFDRAVRREICAIALRRSSKLTLWQKALAELIIFAVIAVLGLILLAVVQSVRHPLFQLHDDPGVARIHYRGT